jgi:hypothetical protein
MAATVADASTILAGAPSNILWAPLGTALPLNTVAGSVFSDVWATSTGWTPLGYTDAGATFTAQTTTTDITVAETLDVVKKLPSTRASSLAAALVQITKSSLVRALNGGLVTVTGATTTLLTQVDPPNLGSEVRCMIGAESIDGTVRVILRQVYNSSNVSLVQNKGAKSLVNCTWDAEVPPGGVLTPFSVFFAGAARGA